MMPETIAHYRITAKLGEGGMGEVWRARDTKLDRDVAIKILPANFAQNPERMARFEREAKVLASLNHPNIAHIYGVEERALVMELVEGESPKGPMPFDEAWKTALQMAEALEYAHEKGVVHRDLKPANVKVTPDGIVKLLDFGLAKAYSDQGESASGDPSLSPTMTLGGTVAGTIMGTAAYMAPEQARGKPVDKRADIWAWGVVLYELLTGEALFQGEDVAETLAAVIHKQPDLGRAPAQVRKLLGRCLEKDPKKRLRDIGVVGELLESAGEIRVQTTAPWRSRLGIGAIAVVTIALASMSWVAWRATRPVLHSLVRLNVDLGPDAVAGVSTTVAISPDGARIVFPARGEDGKQRLATRLLDQAKETILPGTEDGRDPFFSPDGQSIGFFALGKMMKISVLGGAPVTLCDATNPRGGSWAENGSIIAALTNLSGLSRVPDSGGAPEAFTKPVGELSHRWPQVLPGNRGVLFSGTNSNGNQDAASIEVLPFRTNAAKILVKNAYSGRFVPTVRGGYLGEVTDRHKYRSLTVAARKKGLTEPRP